MSRYTVCCVLVAFLLLSGTTPGECLAPSPATPLPSPYAAASSPTGFAQAPIYERDAVADPEPTNPVPGGSGLAQLGNRPHIVEENSLAGLSTLVMARPASTNNQCSNSANYQAFDPNPPTKTVQCVNYQFQARDTASCTAVYGDLGNCIITYFTGSCPTGLNNWQLGQTILSIGPGGRDIGPVAPLYYQSADITCLAPGENFNPAQNAQAVANNDERVLENAYAGSDFSGVYPLPGDPTYMSGFGFDGSNIQARGLGAPCSSSSDCDTANNYHCQLVNDSSYMADSTCYHLQGDFECNSGPGDQKPYTSDCVSMLNTIHTRIGPGGTGPAEQWEQSGTCRVVITPPSTGPPTSADLWTDVEFIIFKCNSNQQTGGSRTLSNGYRVDVNRLPAADYGTPGIPAAPAVNGVPTTTCPTGGQACSNVGSSDGCCPGQTCRSTRTGTSSCQA